MISGAEIPWTMNATLLLWIALIVNVADVGFVNESWSDLSAPTATLPKFRLAFERERPVFELPSPKLWQDVNSIREQAIIRPAIE